MTLLCTSFQSTNDELVCIGDGLSGEFSCTPKAGALVWVGLKDSDVIEPIAEFGNIGDLLWGLDSDLNCSNGGEVGKESEEVRSSLRTAHTRIHAALILQESKVRLFLSSRPLNDKIWSSIGTRRRWNILDLSTHIVSVGRQLIENCELP